MISLLAPVESLTISIYGYHSAGPSRRLAARSPISTAKEDLSWVSAWAGGVDGLVQILGSSVELEIKERALGCLDLLAETGEEVIGKIAENEAAVRYIMSTTSPLVDRILDEHALYPLVRPHIPLSHRLYPFSYDDSRQQAWIHLNLGRHALRILARPKSENDFMEVAKGEETSNMARLLEMAGKSEGGEELELILDILNPPPSDPVVLAHLARVLPRLVVLSRMRNGTSRDISLPKAYAEVVVRSLLLCSAEIPGAFPVAQRLASPYLPDTSDSSLKTAFSDVLAKHPLIPIPPGTTADARRLHRLIQSSSSAYIHSATPSELISLLAPSLHTLLSTAPQPLLGIPPSENKTPEALASAYAGKVYTSNEFRNREAPVGLGIRGVKAGAGAGSAGNVGVGGGLARPASRHVDEYVR